MRDIQEDLHFVDSNRFRGSKIAEIVKHWIAYATYADTRVIRLERIKELARGINNPELQQAIAEYDLAYWKEGC